MKQEVRNVLDGCLRLSEKVKYRNVGLGYVSFDCDKARATALIHASGYLNAYAKEHGEETITIKELSELIDVLSYIDYNKVYDTGIE